MAKCRYILDIRRYITLHNIFGEKGLAIAWVIAFVASLSVIFIGEVMGQVPCTLCWYQRIFMFPLAIVLGLGLWWQDSSVGRYGIVLSLAGAAIAFWHLLMFAGIIPVTIQPCTSNGISCTGDAQLIVGLPIPALSLASFVIIGWFSYMSLKESIDV